MFSCSEIEKKILCQFRMNRITVTIKVDKIEEEQVSCNTGQVFFYFYKKDGIPFFFTFAILTKKVTGFNNGRHIS